MSLDLPCKDALFRRRLAIVPLFKVRMPAAGFFYVTNYLSLLMSDCRTTVSPCFHVEPTDTLYIPLEAYTLDPT